MCFNDCAQVEKTELTPGAQNCFFFFYNKVAYPFFSTDPFIIIIYVMLKSTSVVSSLSFATLHVCHLGHYLTHDLSDDEDIVFRLHDFLKKANLFFYNFKFCSPSTVTFLLRSFCLSLYGCAL